MWLGQVELAHVVKFFLVFLFFFYDLLIKWYDKSLNDFHEKTKMQMRSSLHLFED
jgi:hypothetical protein